jgi:geranylgeranyl diphosphate synthase type II
MAHSNTKTTLLRVLESNKRELDKMILDILPQDSETPEIAELYSMMRDYPSRGGKGLRGSMCLMWCNLFGGRREDSLLTAAALELFQNWILIHDDIEDQSDLRRGLPALHKKVGIERAINTGDALHGKMWEMLLENRRCLGPNLSLDILAEFATMLNETTEGQQIELSWNKSNLWDLKEDDYFLMVTKKAAWYTCISPARLGILIASHGKEGAELRMRNVMREVVSFGTHLGKSFQIVDDILNLMAEESKYGKEILGDLFEGKRTLMLIHLLSTSSAEQKDKIKEILSKPREKKQIDEVRFIFNKMKDSGSIDYAREVAQRLSQDALDEFDHIVAAQGIGNDEGYKSTRTLIEYLASRDY